MRRVAVAQVASPKCPQSDDRADSLQGPSTGSRWITCRSGNSVFLGCYGRSWPSPGNAGINLLGG